MGDISNDKTRQIPKNVYRDMDVRVSQWRIDHNGSNPLIVYITTAHKEWVSWTRFMDMETRWWDWYYSHNNTFAAFVWVILPGTPTPVTPTPPPKPVIPVTPPRDVLPLHQTNYVTFGMVKVKVLDIALDPQLNRPSKAIVGADGSQTSYMGSGGRLLSLSVLATGNEYQNIAGLYKYGKRMAFTSLSSAKYNGHYHITSFTSDEYKPNRFKISMKLQEDYVFNMIQVNFVTYQVKPTYTGNEMVVGDKWQISAT
jgi:hypothetical protein